MQFLAQLWVPIVVSGVAVFIVSALSWMVLPFHKTEFSGLKAEDPVLDALRASGEGPGKYVLPWMDSGKLAQTPEGKAKLERGPIAYLTIAPNGVTNMGQKMFQSLLANILISVFVAYVARHALMDGEAYLSVFRITGTVTFMAYGLGIIHEAIWFSRPMKSLMSAFIDALLFALVTAGVFGWLWP